MSLLDPKRKYTPVNAPGTWPLHCLIAVMIILILIIGMTQALFAGPK